jgi:hypothetical protein
MPPARSRSPCSASMKPWLSTMPVLGECSAATQRSAGSSAGLPACEEQHQVVDAVGGRAFLHAAQLRALRLAVGDDQLAAAPVATPRGAVGVQQSLPRTHSLALSEPGG